MVDVTKTNIPKDDTVTANEAADKAASKSKAGRPKKRTTTKEEPIKVSKLTKQFVNKSRQRIHLGAFALEAGESKTVINAVANALVMNNRTKLYLKNKSLEIK